jgi:hypothetical protein
MRSKEEVIEDLRVELQEMKIPPPPDIRRASTTIGDKKDPKNF